MSEVLAILGLAVMFAGFGMFHRYGQEPRGCSSCEYHESVDSCGSCPHVRDVSESRHD
jgi:hypothetical protein